MRNVRGPSYLTRRDLLRLGVAVGGSALFGALAPRRAGADGDVARTRIRFTPFGVEMPAPELMPAVADFGRRCAFGVSTGAVPVFHEVHMRKAIVQIIPGVDTEIWGYDGLYPGPTLRSHIGTPDVVRMVNELDVETVIHHHGGHNPALSDGSPFPDEIILPGESRDYLLPQRARGRRFPLVQFRVGGGSVSNDATVANGTPLRPNTAIGRGEIVATRCFEFVRSDGAWQINEQFFDPDRIDADPRVGTAERWILKNGGGGWWHPVHIHLESHQIQRFNGSTLLPQQPLQPPIFFKHDTTLLGPGDELPGSVP